MFGFAPYFKKNQNKERAKLRYTNATKVLPQKLITEIQKYVQGETLYIPKPKTEYMNWGSLSGGRRLLEQRNTEIRNAFQNRSSIEQLAKEFFLSTETIKKIVYSHKK
ncbi:CD3324 family protein [Paenibacillus polymyxa]|nr:MULTISPECIES: CD3324 family protein [Paenibacillus]WPQ59363.1 CD3324 family protein [Paenibacillus polymyxa]